MSSRVMSRRAKQPHWCDRLQQQPLAVWFQRLPHAERGGYSGFQRLPHAERGGYAGFQRLPHAERGGYSGLQWLAVLAVWSVGLVAQQAMTAEPAGVETREALPAAEVDFFESKIRPVLVEHCYECHSGDAKIVRGGLLVDSRQGIRAGGDSGPAVVPGELEDSLILGALRHETYEMPPQERLPDEVIADFQRWIRRGAVDPRDEASPPVEQVDHSAALQHWALQPMAEVTPPHVDDDWVQTPIDRFVLHRLRQAGMRPAPRADKATLIRRATFDLTGLPPTPEQVAAFLADDSPDSFAALVDRLLSSPHYGERWGRHWLDLVRYADTNGADENHPLPHAWRYRDWVVRMINRDLPLDAFITQQLAGDLLPSPEDEQAAGDLLAATGMLVIGPKMLAEQDKDKMIIDIVDELVDTVSRTMLGLTVACARCHDHKFDPISTEDYYALAGVFSSTRVMANRDFVSKWLERPLPSAEIAQQRAAHQKVIDRAQRRLDEAEAALAQAEEAQQDNGQQGGEETAADIDQLKQAATSAKEALEKRQAEMPPFEMVMAADEGDAGDLPVHIRGNHLTLAEEAVGRGISGVLAEAFPAPEIPADASGRLQLARWLADPEHPLTWRVMANRIWMWHFGQALVRSPSNFGLRGELPTHPELLDWLARQLPQHGFSLKQMHRLIMLSSTYQMASEVTGQAALRDANDDPENRLLWRRPARRLEAEPIRDAVLAVGGGIDLTIGGKAPDVASHRRAIYLPVNRAALYEMFSTFDYIETANHIEQRPTTTVPHQALFLLNSPMVHQQAERIAEQLLSDIEPAGDELAARIEALFMRLYGRGPSPEELQRCTEFIAAAEAEVDQGDPAERFAQAAAALVRALVAANEFVYIQ